MLGLTGVLVVALHLLLTRTTIGRAMRAVAENPALAERRRHRRRSGRARHLADRRGARRARPASWSASPCRSGPTWASTCCCRCSPPRSSAASAACPGAVLGGLIVGLAEASAVPLVGAEYRAAVAFLVLIAVLLVRPTGLFGSARMMLDLLGYGAFFLTTALTYGIICLGLNLQWGQTGLFNVGVAGFVAIGAYTSALLTTPATAGRFGGFELPIAVGWLARRCVAGVALRSLIGALTLRLRADYLAITTFGVAVTIQLVALNAAGADRRAVRHRLHPAPLRRLVQATALLFNLLNLALVARRRSSSSIWRWSAWCAAPGAGCCAPSARTRRRPPSLGKNAARSTACRPSPSAAPSWAWPAPCRRHFIGFIAPDNYLSTLTFQVWAMLIVGGSGNNRGALLGAVAGLGPVERVRRISPASSCRPTCRRAPRRCRSSHRRAAGPDPAAASARHTRRTESGLPPYRASGRGIGIHCHEGAEFHGEPARG